MRVPYSWLMEYMDADTPADELAEILTMGGLEVEEVEEWTSADGKARDTVLITSVTSNRGDLLSMVGVARHTAALLRCNLKLPAFRIEETASPNVAESDLTQGDTRITIDDLTGCPRYSALRLVGVQIRPSPDWMRHRLEAAGVRPLGNVIDATNYVLLELGQPLHAFDHKLLVRGHIIIRRAGDGEKLVTIDGNTRELSENDLVIADEKGAIALAGVMGGTETEMRERTTDVLLESAHFNPSMIRRTAQRHVMSTEASYRFERFVDPNLTLPALARAAQLIRETAGGEVAGAAIDVHAEDFAREPITLRPARTNWVLGTELQTAEQVELLERLGFGVEMDTAAAEQSARELPDRDWLRPYPNELQALERITVAVPTRRPDIEREIDLIEEIAIIYGYNNMPTTLPGAIASAGVRTREQKLESRVSEVMRGAGICENVSYSMMGGCDLDFLCLTPEAPEREALCLRDPAAENQELMRTTLLPGLLAAAQYNVRRRVDTVALFEIGRVFLGRGEGVLPDERQKLAAICMGSSRVSTWNLPNEYQEMDFYWLKGVVEQLCMRLNVGDLRFERAERSSLHPGRSATVIVGGQQIGHLGEISREVQRAYDLPSPAVVLELDLDTLISKANLLAQYLPQPRFPAVNRDLALVVDQDEAHSGAHLIEAAERSGGDLLESVSIFDVYTDPERLGVGRKSVAMRLVFRDPDRTLTDDEVDEAMRGIIQHMERKLRAEARTW